MLRGIRKSFISQTNILAFLAGGIITYFLFRSSQSVKSANNVLISDKSRRSLNGLDNNDNTTFSNTWTLVPIIHQSWKSRRLPPRFSDWSKSWRECFHEPNWIHILWTDAENEKLVADQYPWFLERYRSFRRNIYRIDSVRYLYMHRFGGIYTDLDNVCLRPFEHLLEGHHLVFGDIVHDVKPAPYWTYIQNSFIYSSPGHPFWLDLVRRISQLDANVDGLPEPLTGPKMMQDVLLDNWKRYGRDVKVYPPDTFNPFSYYTRKSPCNDLNNMNETQLDRCIKYHKTNSNSYVLQLHTQTWDRGKVEVD